MLPQYASIASANCSCGSGARGKATPSAVCVCPPRTSTNMSYCVQAMPAWPNVLSTGSRLAPPQRAAAAPANGSSTAAAPSAGESDRSNGSGSGSGGGGGGSGGARSGGTGGGRLARLNAAMRKRAVGAQALLTEHVAALWLGYKPLTRPDRALLERCACA